MHRLPRNSAGHTLLLFFVSFTRSKSALCHLLCEPTCSLGTDKQLGNVTSVVECSKIVTVKQLGNWTMHIIHIFLRFKLIFSFCWRGNFKTSFFVFHRGFKHSRTIKALGLRPRAFISFLVFETPMKRLHSFLKYYLKDSVFVTDKCAEIKPRFPVFPALCGRGLRVW